MCWPRPCCASPDTATRDALDPRQDRRRRLGGAPATRRALFVNAATWGLMITGKLVATSSEATMAQRADAPHRQGRRTADPQGRRPRHAADGRAVRVRRDDRTGAGQRPQARSQGFRHSYRHARRSRGHRRRRAALLPGLRARDPCDRQRPADEASTTVPASRSSFRRCIRATHARRERACSPSCCHARARA